MTASEPAREGPRRHRSAAAIRGRTRIAEERGQPKERPAEGPDPPAVHKAVHDLGVNLHPRHGVAVSGEGDHLAVPQARRRDSDEDDLVLEESRRIEAGQDVVRGDSFERPGRAIEIDGHAVRLDHHARAAAAGANGRPLEADPPGRFIDERRKRGEDEPGTRMVWKTSRTIPSVPGSTWTCPRGMSTSGSSGGSASGAALEGRGEDDPAVPPDRLGQPGVLVRRLGQDHVDPDGPGFGKGV